MASSVRVISLAVAVSLLASTTTAVATPVRPGASKVALAAAVAVQSAEASADQRLGSPVSTEKSPHAQALTILEIGLGLGLSAALIAALAGGGSSSHSVSPD